MSPWIDDKGEVGKCPICERREVLLDEKDMQIEGLQRDIRGWASRYGELKRETERKSLPDNHPHRNDAEIAFKEWAKRCNHPRSQFTASRFWLVVPFLESPAYGLKVVLQAIAGAEYDAYVHKRRNGTKRRLDEWERIFENAGSLEEFASRAPGAGGLKVAA